MKQATAEAMAEDIGHSSKDEPKELAASEISGTKDKVAEEVLTKTT